MNRFLIEDSACKIAKSLCDKHVVKMVLEETQMLSTAIRFMNLSLGDRLGLYEICNINHPCNLWVRKTRTNYYFAVRLLRSMLEEYTYRYKRVHTCNRYLSIFGEYAYLIPDGPLTQPPQALGDFPHYRTSEFWPVEAYRKYYLTKRRFARWTRRLPPDWFIEGLKNGN